MSPVSLVNNNNRHIISPISVDGGISNSSITAPAAPTLVNVSASRPTHSSFSSSTTILAHPVTYQTTLGLSGPVLTRNDVCVSGTVIAALAICIVLLLSSGLACRRIRVRWIRNYSQRRINSSTVATAMSFNHRRLQMSISSELPFAPYPGNTLPSSSNDDDDTQDVPVNNAVTPEDQISNATFTNTSFDAAQTSVTSLSSINAGELSMPPTPFIPTIPLPSVDTHGYLLHSNSSSSNHENDTSIQSCSTPVGETQSSESEDYNSNSNPEPIGSLGLILGIAR